MRKLNSELFEMYRRPQPLVLPELLSVGWCRTDYSRLGGPRTDGQDAFEVGYLERGSLEWWTEGGLEEAGPGSVIIDRPGDWQGGVNAIVHPCQRYWIRFNFPPLGTLPGLTDETAEHLSSWFHSQSRRHFPASPRHKGHFEQLLDLQRNPGAFAEEASRAIFHLILFLAVHDGEREDHVEYSPPVVAALAFFDDQAADDCHVDAVADHVGLSVGYFHELFVRETGLTPSQYHLRKRIALAKRELIHSDISVTHLAASIGFSSSQYFATVFRKVVGLTPTEYRTLRDVPARPQARHPSNAEATS
jgi:AraC family L-rhamnose operon regulatory protein RhaS